MSVRSHLFLAAFAAATAIHAEPVKGVVKSVDPKEGVMTITRADTKTDVTGYAPSGDLAPERVGTVVAGDYLASDAAGKTFRFEKLRPADDAGETRIAVAAAHLHAETAERGRNKIRAVGDTLPEFVLRDQYGGLVSNADLNGKYVVFSFIFSRCRSPEMCPASTRKMVELSRKLKEAGIGNALMISITFDPDFDTSGILKGYADGYGADGGKHKFLTGPAGLVSDLQRQFGVQTVEDDGTIIHNVVTTLVTPAGRILHRFEGPRWEVADFLRRIEKHRSGK